MKKLKEKIGLYLRWRLHFPYWITRFLYKTDGYSLTNFEYMQFAVFGRWSKTYYQDVFYPKTGKSSFTYRGLDKDAYARKNI